MKNNGGKREGKSEQMEGKTYRRMSTPGEDTSICVELAMWEGKARRKLDTKER